MLATANELHRSTASQNVKSEVWHRRFSAVSLSWAWVASAWHETVPRQQRRIIQISVHTLVLRFKRWPKPDFMMTERRRVDDFGPRRTFASVLGIRFSRLHCRSSWRVSAFSTQELIQKLQYQHTIQTSRWNHWSSPEGSDTNLGSLLLLAMHVV